MFDRWPLTLFAINSQKYFETTGDAEVESELRPKALEKAWDRLLAALADRDHILQEEVIRLERLQRLAEKVQREIVHTDSRISDLERRIIEEGRRIEQLHPIDAKNIVESLETEIRHLEQPIHDMNQDCVILRDGHYPQAKELQKSVTKLHQRWSTLCANFHKNLVNKLSGLRYPIQETTVTKQTRTVFESRQVDTNPYFKDLQEYTEWCQNKLVIIGEGRIIRLALEVGLFVGRGLISTDFLTFLVLTEKALGRRLRI